MDITKEIEKLTKDMSLDEKIAYTGGYRAGMLFAKSLYNPEPIMSQTGLEEETTCGKPHNNAEEECLECGVIKSGE